MTAHIRKEPSKEHIGIATDIFKLVSDPTRLKILWSLLHGEHSVGEGADEVGMLPSVVSQHLAKLRISHMVSMRREGTKIFYKAENEHVLHLIEHAFTQADHIRSGEHE
jgi:DNA-binding transcriptional ArsR family regulator